MNLPIVAILALAAGVASVEILTECPPYDPEGTTVHLPHESDSTKFYKCVMGEKYEMYCDSDNDGNKLHFNPELQICDNHWNVKSLDDIPSIFQCPPKGSHEVKLIPHECFCNVYFLCKDGIRIRQECPPNTEFDYEKQLCGPPDEVNCVRPITP